MGFYDDYQPQRTTLRDLPFAARATITVFLLAVGLGYFSALVQMHFKHASPGQMMPGIKEMIYKFSGQEPPRLLKPPEEPAAAAPEPKAAAAPAADGKPVAAVKIKSIITDRCGACHSPTGERNNEPLTNYDEIGVYLGPSPAKSKLHRLLTAGPEVKFGKESMVLGFTSRHPDWNETLKERQADQALLREERKTE